jgi:hypothetical protein
MNSSAEAAQSDNISSLEEAILGYTTHFLPEHELWPQINSSSSKSDTRGFNHLMLSCLLCLIQYLEQFDEDPEQ